MNAQTKHYTYMGPKSLCMLQRRQSWVVCVWWYIRVCLWWLVHGWFNVCTCAWGSVCVLGLFEFLSVHLFVHVSAQLKWVVNTMKPKQNGQHEQNGQHFADNILKCILLNESVRIVLNISFKFVPKGLFHNNSALPEVMAWYRIDMKPLPETMLTQICDMSSLGVLREWHFTEQHLVYLTI